MASKIGIRPAVFEKLRLIIFPCPEVVCDYSHGDMKDQSDETDDPQASAWKHMHGFHLSVPDAMLALLSIVVPVESRPHACGRRAPRAHA